MYSAAVVGAGPAGSTAARFLSEMGHKVLLIDRKEVVGVPKQCAEGLFAACFPEFETAVGDFITGKVPYLEVVFPNRASYRVRGEVLMLDRPRFDQHLLRLAEGAGAEVALEVEEIDPESGVLRLRGGEVVRAEAIVGADGPASRVGRAIRARNRLLPAAQVEMTWPEDDAIYAIIDRDLPSEPYSCWIFLKNERGTANVGCFGTVPTLEAFISKYRIEGEIVEKNGGAIPLGVAERLQRGRAVLIGDAGGLTNPFTGGGLYPAARSARIAAEAIDRFLRGETRTIEYEARMRRDVVASDLHLKARDALAALSNDELCRLGTATDGLVFPGLKFTASPWLVLRRLRHPGIAKPKYAPLLKLLFRYCLAGKVW
ncbi:MAG TPA: NAD(P)/FAD-dependent oxidoreductase [Methanothrix sp.]|nr:NAD(P)/FAD-dependent oxidoreductase [Methanothrix sp.]